MPIAAAVLVWGMYGEAPLADPSSFHIPADPAYTILDSAIHSARFTLERTLRPYRSGHLASISSFVDPEATPMMWHDFGPLEGPGWAANAAGGAHELCRLGRFLGQRDWEEKALSILDHILDDGFIDRESGLIRPYRHTVRDAFVLNFKSNDKWLCPGSLAKIACQILSFADDIPQNPRAARMREAAVGLAGWLTKHVPLTPSGWYPRRVTPAGEIYRDSAEGGKDPLWDHSADGLYIIWLLGELSARGLLDARDAIRGPVAAFVRAGGIFGSINHDTYDREENVAFAVAYRVLRRAARWLDDPALARFARERCLAGLDRFKLCTDANGVACKGLLYMETSWDTAYLWESAEAALAFFEDFEEFPDGSRRALDGLTILRAIAKHHDGPYGFLTEGVDWNGHIDRQHHRRAEPYAAIRYTEPFLNNQHIIEPTLFYLERLAKRERRDGDDVWLDIEGNEIHRRKSG